MTIRIDQCTFGSMIIAGHTYTTDLMILPDGQIMDNWWRQAGHRFCMADIQPLVDAHPDIIVAGTGINGMVQVPEELVLALFRSGIELQAFKTLSAARSFNGLVRTGKRVAGCFHLTC